MPPRTTKASFDHTPSGGLLYESYPEVWMIEYEARVLAIIWLSRYILLANCGLAIVLVRDTKMDFV